MGGRLEEGLAFEWRCERMGEALLRSLLDRADAPEVVAALTELASAARVRRSRIERRLEAVKARPLLAPLSSGDDRLDEGLERALGGSRAAADRYAALAELARQVRDAETAFACELNRIGAEEAGSLIEVLLDAETERRAAELVGAPSAARAPARLAVRPFREPEA
jgi:hypothetical protein